MDDLKTSAINRFRESRKALYEFPVPNEYRFADVVQVEELLLVVQNNLRLMKSFATAEEARRRHPLATGHRDDAEGPRTPPDDTLFYGVSDRIGFSHHSLTGLPPRSSDHRGRDGGRTRSRSRSRERGGDRDRRIRGGYRGGLPTVESYAGGAGHHGGGGYRGGGYGGSNGGRDYGGGRHYGGQRDTRDRGDRGMRGRCRGGPPAAGGAAHLGGEGYRGGGGGGGRDYGGGGRDHGGRESYGGGGGGYGNGRDNYGGDGRDRRY